jgi:hypothetical protein
MKHRSILLSILTASLFFNCELFVDDNVSIDCSYVIDAIYDEDCEMWCEDEDPDDWQDAPNCSWWNDYDPANYDERDAVDVCEEMVKEAQKEHCIQELGDWLRCSLDKIKEVDDGLCAEDCENPYEKFLDCID